MISRVRVFDKISTNGWAILLLLSNLLVIFGTELAHDEAYYWLFSKHLGWGYFDHPPMTAWLIALSSWMGGEFGVRCVFVTAMQATGWVMSSLVQPAHRWALWAGLNVFPLLAFAGVFAIPDGPLVFFSAFWLWALKHYLERDNFQHAVLMGIATALLFYSKYHGVLYVAGTLLALPQLLKRGSFWMAVLVGLILFIPHIHWQWAHDFATFRYHFVDRPKIAAGLRQPLEFILLQLFLPGVLIAPFVWRAFWQKVPGDQFERALKWMVIFIPSFFFLSTFSKKLEANWTVAAGLPMLILVARGSLDWLVKTRLARVLGVLSIFMVIVARLLLVIPPEWHGIKRAREFHGWRQWSQAIDSRTGSCHLAANRYQIAAKLSFYLAKEVPALNVGSRLNQFEFWDQEKSWGDSDICWVTERSIFPGQAVVTPDRKKLFLVKGLKLVDILKHKEKSL